MFNRFFIAAPIALALSAAFVGAAAGPALAAPSNVCETAPAALRSLAATAQPEVARAALYKVNVGVQLCAADARNEARSYFAAASKKLGVELATLTATSVAAQ